MEARAPDDTFRGMPSQYTPQKRIEDSLKHLKWNTSKQ